MGYFKLEINNTVSNFLIYTGFILQLHWFQKSHF